MLIIFGFYMALPHMSTVQWETSIIDEISKLTASIILISSVLSLQNRDENILTQYQNRHEQTGIKKAPGFKQTNLEPAVP